MNSDSHYLLISEYVSNYDNLVRNNKTKTYLLRPEFFPLYIEIFSQNELLYTYIDEIYNSKITCYNKASVESTYYQLAFLDRLAYRRNIYAKKVLGILEYESNIDFIDSCLKKGWRKLYKYIVNNSQWEMFEIMSRFTNFSSPTDKSVVIALLVGGLHEKVCFEARSHSWSEKTTTFLNSCICFYSASSSSITVDTLTIDSFGFQYIKSFNDLYIYFNSDDNDCISEVKMLTKHLVNKYSEETIIYFNNLLNSTSIIEIQLSQIKKIKKYIGIDNIEYLISLSQACNNYSLRKNTHFKKAFELFKMVNEIFDRCNISKDVFETVVFTPKAYKEIATYVTRTVSKPSPMDFLVAYIAFAISNVYNKQKEEAFSSSLLLPLAELEKMFSELQSSIDKIRKLEEENHSLKSQCIYLEKRLNSKDNLEQENLQLLAKITNLTKEVSDYKIQTNKLNVLIQELEHLAQRDAESLPLPETSVFFHACSNLNICLIGGYPSWRNKIQANFPNWSVLTQAEAMRTHFDEKELDLIVINIIGIPHSLFYKVTTQLSNYDKLLIINTSNFELTYELIKQRLLSKNTYEEKI